MVHILPRYDFELGTVAEEREKGKVEVEVVGWVEWVGKQQGVEEEGVCQETVALSNWGSHTEN